MQHELDGRSLGLLVGPQPPSKAAFFMLIAPQAQGCGDHEQ